MTGKATVLTKPRKSGATLIEFDCLFDEPHPTYAVCHCSTTPVWAKNNPSFKRQELQTGNKIVLQEGLTVEKSIRANLFLIDRIERSCRDLLQWPSGESLAAFPFFSDANNPLSYVQFQVAPPGLED